MSARLTPEELVLNRFAEELVTCAKMLAADHGADAVLCASALSFASTKMLFRAAPSHNVALQGVAIMNDSATKAVADMIAGANADHQVTQ